jgi:hypothetical protein
MPTRNSQLVNHDGSRHRSIRPLDRLVDLHHGQLLEDDANDVLDPENVSMFGLGGHDHRGRPVAAGQPGALSECRGPADVVDDILAEVPHRAIIGLCIAISPPR